MDAPEPHPNLAYLRYVLRHKRFVFEEGRRLGVPLWNLVWHDWTKFLPSEWTPYVDYFYRKYRYASWGDVPFACPNRLALREGVKTERDAAFDRAWNLHQKRNRHHWQAHILHRDDGTVEALPMPDVDMREMVADWAGAGRAIHGKREVAAWYGKNKGKMVLHPATRARVELLLEVHYP